MKVLFFLIFLISSTSYALEPSQYLGSSMKESQKKSAYGKDPDKNHYLGSKRREAENRHMGNKNKTQKPRFTKEMTNIYLRSGLSLGNLSQERERLSMFGLGVRRTSGSTYYGLEYSQYNNDEAKSFLLQLQYGWMPARNGWNHRIVPFLGLQAGYASSEFSSVRLNNGEGLALSIDGGIELWRNNMFNIMTGVKSTWTVLEETNGEDQHMLDLYMSFGFRF